MAVTGSLCPSSSRLARAVTEIANGKQNYSDEIVFAGIGNGVIAKQFLKWNQKVTFVDIERAFCEPFARAVQLEGHRVVCSDVVEYLAAGSDSARRFIVSCLPLHGPYFSLKIVDALVEEVRRGGMVVFYSYFPLIWGTRLARSLDEASLVARRERTVVWNFPPAYVYSITRCD